MSRFQPTGTPLTFDPLFLFGKAPTAADLAFQLAQQSAYVACMQLIAGVNNDAAQLKLMAIRVPLTVATLTAAGATTSGPASFNKLVDHDLANITDWSATLTLMQVVFGQLQKESGARGL